MVSVVPHLTRGILTSALFGLEIYFLPGYFSVIVTSAVSLKLWMNLCLLCFARVLDGVEGTRITFVVVEEGLGVDFLLKEWILSRLSHQPKQNSHTCPWVVSHDPDGSHGNEWLGCWVTTYWFPFSLLPPPSPHGKDGLERRARLESEELVGIEW